MFVLSFTSLLHFGYCFLISLRKTASMTRPRFSLTSFFLFNVPKHQTINIFYLISNLRHLETHILYIASIQSVCERFIMQVCSELWQKTQRSSAKSTPLIKCVQRETQCKLMLRELFVLFRLTYEKGGF